MRIRLLARAVAGVAVLGMVAAACGGGGGTQNPTTAPGGSPTGVHKGGSGTFGAEQWPQCLNFITSCATSTWMQIVGPQPTLPKLIELGQHSDVIASPLITEVPSLTNGGITQNPFTVTYHLNPKAVWSDGTPITSADVEFTWKAIINTTGTTSTIGYTPSGQNGGITAIDTSDPHTVKLTFNKPYADWYDLFGGGSTNGYVAEKAAFPNAKADKPDLAKEMNNMISFSGGPWKMTSWSKSQEVLVRNDKYWGHQPNLDQVTFIPLEEQPQEIAALLSGQVDAIFPQAGAASVTSQLKANPNAKSVSGPTNYGDAFWFNLDDPVLKDFAVRQAIAYGVDRQAIIDQIIKINDPSAQVLNCLPPLFPVVDQWCSQAIQAPMAQYTYDPQKAIAALTAAGYDCSKVPSSPCTKGGQPLTVTEYYTAGNTRRQAVGALVQERIKPAGIKWVVKPNDATDLFSNKLPKGDYQVIEYAAGATVDPGPTSFSWLSTQVPTAANKYSGANYQHYRNASLDPIMIQADAELDVAKRHQLIDQVYSQINKDIASLPLYPFINITAWRSDKIGGPIGSWNEASYGTYYNMDQWFSLSA